MDIYREELLEHYREPRNWGVREGEGAVHEEVNRLCGDAVKVQVILKAGRVKEMRFEGHGCVISVAACSLVSEQVRGKEAAVIKKMGLAHVQSLLGVTFPPRRVPCALLGLEALKRLL